MTDTYNSPDLFDATILEYQDIEANPDKTSAFTLPIPWLSKRVRWRQGWLHMIGGKPGRGKSTLLSMCAIELGKSKVNTLYITLEDGLTMTCQRILSNILPASREHFRDGKLTVDEKNKLYTDGLTFKDYPIIWTTNSYTESEILSRMAACPWTPTWVCLDYLSMMEYSGMDLRERIDAATYFLVRMAHGYYTNGVPVGVIANLQLNDENESYGSRTPNRASDLYLKVNDVDGGNGRPLPDRKIIWVEKFKHGVSAEGHTFTFWGDQNRIAELVQKTGGLPIP